MTKRTIGLGVAMAAVAVVLASLAWRAGWAVPGRGAGPAGSAASAASAPLQFRADELVQPQRARLDRQLEFSGPLVAPGSAVVRAKAAGTLVESRLAEGDRVVPGQALGRVDAADLESRIAERAANLESARATLAQAERSHAANERLAAQGFISGAALDSTRAQLDTARAALAAAQASLDTTRAARRDVLLRAPIAGIVAKRHALDGEQLAVEQPVLTLVDLRRLELAGSVGTHEVARLAVGMPVAVAIEGVEQVVEGRLARIAPAAEAGTRAIGVTVALDNPGERLRAGQFALARVRLPDAQDRLLLPQAAVQRSGGVDAVWLVERGALVRRAVTLGRRDEAGGRVEVLSGLDERARVLAARFDNLREGSAVVVAGAAAPAAPAAASTARN